jgi:hypothetical protein
MIKIPRLRKSTNRLRAASGPTNDVYVNENTLVVNLSRENLLVLANDPTSVWVAPTQPMKIKQIIIKCDPDA